MYSYNSIFFFLVPFLLISSPCLGAREIPTYKAEPESIVASTPSHTPWMEFEKFLDAGRGSQINGLSAVKRYLHRFGYMKTEQDMNFTDMFDARMEDALANYQARLGLSVTGKLDSGTLHEIMSPRCGVSDHTPGNMLHATKRYTYFLRDGQPASWRRKTPMTLTYAFSPVNPITYLSKTDIKDALKRAFSHWASVVPISFTETDDYSSADIKIGFYDGDHGDIRPFDGALGILAHAYAPEIGKLDLDAAETWAVDFRKEKSKFAIDLESVATHEIGHLLGLGHSSEKDAVMYPNLSTRQKKVDLKLDDINGVQALYGSSPKFSLGATPRSGAFVNDATDLGAISTRWSILMLLGMLSLCV